MAKNQLYFIVLMLLLTGLPLVLHVLRARMTLGPFFGLAGVYSILLWQMLQTGWWVSFGQLNFNAGLTTFIPAILMGSLLTFALDGLRTARSYLAMVLTACLAAWLFAEFREALAQYVPLPYLVVLSSREHFAIIAGLMLAQMMGMVCYAVLRRWWLWPSLPLALLMSILSWLWVYSLVTFGPVMGLRNVLNEQYSFMLAGLPVLMAVTLYGAVEYGMGLIMPRRSLRSLLTFWRAPAADGRENGDDLTNRDRVLSEVRLLNRAQETSNRLMEYHMANAPYGIVITDPVGVIRRCNAPAEQMMGVGEPVGRNLAVLMERLLGQELNFGILAFGSQGRRWATSDHGGGARWLEVVVTPLREGDALDEITGYYFLLKDDTAAVREELRQQAARRIRDLSETGKVLTHDFSNLLLGAEAQLRRLEGRLADRDSTEAMQGVSIALKQARAMLQQLGAGSQFGAPRLKTERLYDLVLQAAEICRGAAAEAGVAIALPPPAVWCVEADASQIVRVLTNLISNAVRACDAGGRVELRLQAHGAGVEVAVVDDGGGMSDAQLSMAFEPGFSTKGEGKGGLGLAISYLMVDAHGGHLQLQRNPDGRGICASVWLPETVCVLAFKEHAGQSVIVASHFPEKIASAITRLETDLGCEVAEAHAEDEVIALLGEPGMHWDVVLLDAGMDEARVREACGPDVALQTIHF